MSTIRVFAGKRPVIGRGVFLAETAAVIGDVEIGEESSIWYGTTIRGDVMPIRIGARTSVQDGTVVHVTSGKFGTTIGSDCTVGHGAIIHACVVEDFCLIGMGSIILDGARIGRGSLVGAGALVTPGTDIPPDSLVIGSPARVKRPVNAKEREQIAYGAAHYVELTRVYLANDDGSPVA
ncbi:MAG: gamma carbonic anhydrase family protein [Deltaproteobacteria bacterium]|nr:gamma carbonic anhydrase family protein [Deltaproteobacteria bacterium]MDQ3300829.1 gamma carbonic anhydrase family protein [Myxococcota bacterium]